VEAAGSRMHAGLAGWRASVVPCQVNFLMPDEPSPANATLQPRRLTRMFSAIKNFSLKLLSASGESVALLSRFKIRRKSRTRVCLQARIMRQHRPWFLDRG
jgi:hypothetical protein